MLFLCSCKSKWRRRTAGRRSSFPPALFVLIRMMQCPRFVSKIKIRVRQRITYTICLSPSSIDESSAITARNACRTLYHHRSVDTFPYLKMLMRYLMDARRTSTSVYRRFLLSVFRTSLLFSIQRGWRSPAFRSATRRAKSARDAVFKNK